MKKIISLIIFVTLLAGCKTQEQIRREQQINTMSVQMTQSQKLSANATVRLQNVEEKINTFQGVLEESAHAKDKRADALEEKITALEELIKVQTEDLRKSREQYVLVEQRLEAQDKFINEIIKSLKGSSKKKKKLGLYDESMNHYRRGRYKSARIGLEKLFKKKLRKSHRARVLHNLGMISFMDKRNEDALTYFSKLFTEFPKSTYNANGLINLAKTFKRMGQNDQAKDTLNQMLKSFPKHKRAKTAKALLKKL